MEANKVRSRRPHNPQLAGPGLTDQTESVVRWEMGGVACIALRVSRVLVGNLCQVDTGPYACVVRRVTTLPSIVII